MDICDKDTRQKLEEDIRSYVLHVGEATVMSERTDEQVVHGWLDRQAAITRAETCGCPGYDADRHYCKYHANDFELTREQVCDLKREVSRLERERDELQAKLDGYEQTHMDKNAVQSYNSDVQVVAEQKNEYTIELRHRCGATTSISVAFRLE